MIFHNWQFCSQFNQLHSYLWELLQYMAVRNLYTNHIIHRTSTKQVSLYIWHFTCLNRYHRLSRYISRYINYGRHEENEFHYNDTMKMLSVSYFGKWKQTLYDSSQWIFCYWYQVGFFCSSFWWAAIDSGALPLQSKSVYVFYQRPAPQPRRTSANVGGEPMCLSKCLCHGRFGSRQHLPHHPLCQCCCLLCPW